MKKLNYFLLFAFLSMVSIEIGAMKRSLHESSSNQLHDELIEKKQKQEVLIKEKIIDQLIKKLPCVLNQIILEYLGSGPQKISEIKIDSEVTEICHFKDDKVFVGFGDGKIEIWDATTCKYIDTLALVGNKSINYLCISDDISILSAQFDSYIKIWNLNNKECIDSIKIPSNYFYCYCLVGNNRIILPEDNGEIRIYDLDKKSFIDVLKGHSATVDKMCSLGNNKFVSVSCSDQRMIVWNLNNKKSDIIKLSKLNSAIFCLVYLGNNKVALGSGKLVQIWDLNNEQCINSFFGGDIAYSLGISDNVLFIASGMLQDKKIQAWNLDNGKCLSTIVLGPKEESGYLCLCIPNNNILVSTLKDIMVVWDLNRQFDYLNSFNNVEN